MRGGDTLGSIAAQLWGDASLWWKLAEANGMGGNASLSEGQTLTIPTGVLKSAHSASTFTPYDPADILGDTAPTTPVQPKPKRNNCGTFGQVLLVVIAVAVTMITKNAVYGEKIMGLAAAGATGSAVSQAVGVATGIQQKFSWNQVGLAAIGSALGGSKAGIGGDSFKADMLRGAARSIVTQGVGVATGMQHKFSWAGVAAASVGAGFARQAGAHWIGESTQGAARHFGVGMAAMIGNAATRSLIEGTDFGDNALASLPDVIGQTIGNAVAGQISTGGFGRGVGKAFAAVGDTLGLDGSFGYDGPDGRNLSLAGPGDAIEGVADSIFGGRDAQLAGGPNVLDTITALYGDGWQYAEQIPGEARLIPVHERFAMGQDRQLAIEESRWTGEDPDVIYRRLRGGGDPSAEPPWPFGRFDGTFSEFEEIARYPLDWGTRALGELGAGLLEGAFGAQGGVLDDAVVLGGGIIQRLRLGRVGAGASVADDALARLPLSQSELRGVQRYNPNIPAHVMGAEAEAQLARVVQSMDDMQVIRWGDPIGSHGADIVSVNTRTAELFLWDAKYRGTAMRLTESETFTVTSKLNGALAQAAQTIERTTLLSPSVRAQVLANLEQRIYHTRTLAYGVAKNSVIRRAGPDQ